MNNEFANQWRNLWRGHYLVRSQLVTKKLIIQWQFSKSARLCTLRFLWFLSSKANPGECSGFSLTTTLPWVCFTAKKPWLHSLTNTQNKCSSIQLSRTIAHSKLTILLLSESTRCLFISKLAMVPVWNRNLLPIAAPVVSTKIMLTNHACSYTIDTSLAGGVLPGESSRWRSGTQLLPRQVSCITNLEVNFIL